MSINDFMNKIKGQIGIDRNTLLTLVILVFVGLGSFGLGRLSGGEDPQNQDIKLDNINAISVKEEIGNTKLVEGSLQNVESIFKEKVYMASKNGKLYYSIGCSGANRIAEKNKVWFSTEQEAIDTGYSKASSCK